MRRIMVLACACLTGIVATRAASACGLTPPVGPSGLPTVCHGDASVRVRAGAAGGGTWTRIAFGSKRATLLQSAATTTLDAFPWERVGFGVALGAALGGSVELDSRRHTLSPGPLGGVSASYRLWGGQVPFVQLSLGYSLATSVATASDGTRSRFTSRDYRVGATVGHAVGRHAAPFVVARYFGAGTSWSVAGGKGADVYRYQIGVGSAFAVDAHLDGLVELAVLGERRATLGVGYSF